MSPARLLFLTILTMVAFAGNSLLCRLALEGMDAAGFTGIRLLSGAAMLWLLVRWRRGVVVGAGNWWSAAALFAYAAGFSFAYVHLPAATGALLLFAAVQITMVSYGLWRGERLSSWQWTGLLVAAGGVTGLLLPGLAAPPLGSALLMLAAGGAWGIYSLRGRQSGDPLQATAGNFLRALPMALPVWLGLSSPAWPAGASLGYAVASGALASGLGYALWYHVLPALGATRAATVQLSVPVLAALGGMALLGEPFSLRLGVATVAVLGGIALAIRPTRSRS